MLKYFCNFFKRMEQWDKYQASSFWLYSISLYISFSTGFRVLFTESLRQSDVAI
jgi:hypothetical protein